MANSMAMENASADAKESAERQRQASFETQFKTLTNDFLSKLTSSREFTVEDTQSNFFSCNTDEDKESAERYFEDLISRICASFQSKTENSRMRLDVRKLEDLITNQFQKRFITINPQDFCAQEGGKLKIAPESQFMLEAFQEIGREAAIRKNMILKQPTAGTPPEALDKQITEQTRDIIRKKVEEAFKKMSKENQKAELPVDAQPLTKQSHDTKEVSESAPRVSCAPSNWKGYALTATIASAATLGIAYAALKVSGYTLTK